MASISTLPDASRNRLIDDICRFRARVWQATAGVADGAFPGGIWRDEHDDAAMHWIVRDEQGRILGAARLLLLDHLYDVPEAFQYQRFEIEPQGLIAAPDKVVVCPSAQRRGIASALLAAQDDAAIAAGATVAIRQASPRMARLLADRGWQLLGPALPDRRFPGIEFVVATKNYPQSVKQTAHPEIARAA
jgi:GNAT superfamily N-acetyltransferase